LGGAPAEDPCFLGLSLAFFLTTLLCRIHLFLFFSLIRRSIKPRQIGRAPILGRPRLFGGKLLDYIQVTEQPIPLIISSCVSVINRLGLHNQVCIFFV
jgi:hypothetical protein